MAGDMDSSGSIDKNEFRNAVASLKLKERMPAEVCDAMFDEFDFDGSGEIEYREYIKYSLRDALTRSMTRVSDLFRKWDVDQSGLITKQEFRRAIKEIGIDAPRAELDELFAEVDTDKSGGVSFRELQSFIRRGAAATLEAMRLAATYKKKAKKKVRRVVNSSLGSNSPCEEGEAAVQAGDGNADEEGNGGEIEEALSRASTSGVEPWLHNYDLSSSVAAVGVAPQTPRLNDDASPPTGRPPLPRYVSYHPVAPPVPDLAPVRTVCTSATGADAAFLGGTSAPGACERRERLKELKALLEDGLIGEEDFAMQKSRILGQI